MMRCKEVMRMPQKCNPLFSWTLVINRGTSWFLFTGFNGFLNLNFLNFDTKFKVSKILCFPSNLFLVFRDIFSHICFFEFNEWKMCAFVELWVNDCTFVYYIFKLFVFFFWKIFKYSKQLRWFRCWRVCELSVRFLGFLFDH